jgi:signal transduction histidine kinase/FixJ family two-component response regulator
MKGSTGSFSKGIVDGTLDAISDGVQIVSPEWRYLYVNEAACRHGRRRRDELLGRTMMECYPGIDETRMFRILSACMQDRTSRSFDNAFTYGDGAVGIFDLRVEPCPDGLFVLSVDVTERRRLEAELRQAQKMEAVGRLAGGVAHDFNNLLTAMEGFAGFALDRVGPFHPAANDMREVRAAVERAGQLTRKLVAFSRESPVSAHIVDVNGLVTSLQRSLGSRLGEDVEVETKLSARPCRAVVDPGAFEQMVTNLAVNAAEAMPAGGAITIETSDVVLEMPQSLSHGQVVPAGEYVVLSVADEGTGMESSVLEKIFEPFFSTKPAGRGTGLGLSSCYGIVRQAGGYIGVHSELGRGSTFKVYVPSARGPVSLAAIPPPPEISEGQETIMLVEDDWQVREVAERALVARGYTVLSAASSQEALDLLAKRGRAPDLLLTEMALPDGTGYDLAVRMRARHSGLRVLYIAGHTDASITGQAVPPRGGLVLAKPFSAASLARTARQALDQDPPSDSALGEAVPRPLVLIVDDDDILRRALKRQLSSLGCDVLEATNGSHAIHVASEACPAVIFVDLYMPGADGHSLLRRLPISGVRSAPVVMSGEGNVDDVIAALRNGACDYLKKPWSSEELASSLRRALEIYRVAEGSLEG